MLVLFYFLSVLIGYILGCSNMAFYISKIKKTDIAAQGSKNLGTANTLTVCGFRASVIVLIHDLGKSVVAVIIAHYAFPSAAYADVVAGAASIVGHIFPFYLKFRGGKGYASYLGVMLALNWKYTLIAFAATAITTMLVNYMIVGNAVTVIPYPVFLAASGNYVRAAVIAAAAILVLIKHGSHFINLFRGNEPKFWDSIRKKKTPDPQTDSDEQA